MKLTVYWLGWNGGHGRCDPCDERGFVTEDWEEMAVELSLEELSQRIQPYFPEPCSNFDIHSLEVEL